MVTEMRKAIVTLQQTHLDSLLAGDSVIVRLREEEIRVRLVGSFRPPPTFDLVDFITILLFIVSFSLVIMGILWAIAT